MKRLALVTGGALLLGLAVLAGAAGYTRTLLEPVATEAIPQVFAVERGDGLSRVAAELEAAGLVRSALATKWLGRMRGLATQLKAGEYDLTASMSTREILERLRSGMVKTHEVVFPEGIRVSEIAQRLEEAGIADATSLLALASDREFVRGLGIEADSLEGYLFPETYHFTRSLPPEEILGAMVGQFERVWSHVEGAARQRGMSMQQVVTLASIVEKETAAPEERPLIAAVFLNRLRKGMRLETDPAVIYGIPDFDGNLTRSHLQDRRNPYNTYRIAGLPPGPIASPGEASLQAVVDPEQTEYLYFVSRNDGSHHFSATYAEHLEAVNRYQRRRRRR